MPSDEPSQPPAARRSRGVRAFFRRMRRRLTGGVEAPRPTETPVSSAAVDLVDGVVHYCVTNMPGAVPYTSTYALTNATLPFVKALAKLGTKEALAQDPHLANGLNVDAGAITHEAVAVALNLPYRRN